MHRLPGETPFPETAARLQYHNDGFFPLRRNHSQLDFACLNIEHGIRRIPLREDNLLFRNLQRRIVLADLLEEGLWIKCRHRIDSHGLLPLKGEQADLVFGQEPYQARKKAIWSKLLSSQIPTLSSSRQSSSGKPCLLYRRSVQKKTCLL